MNARATGEEVTSSFGRYADWYDAFNHEKHYEAEVRYVLEMLEEIADPPRRWLDIGCGTGRHLSYLFARGIAVEGLDHSPAMIARARSSYPDIPFHVGTAQDLTMEGNRDVVSMLFHVMNYQVSDAMVGGALERIAAHLAPTGVFVFDFWNSEAVLRDPPVRRVRETQVEGRSLFRVSNPIEDQGRRLIDVQYQFHWDSPEGALVHEEVHTLRHFSRGEFETLLRAAGMTMLKCQAWMTERRLSPDDWYGFICAGREDPR